MRKQCIISILLGIAVAFAPLSASSHEANVFAEKGHLSHKSTDPCPPKKPKFNLNRNLHAASEGFLYLVDHCPPPTPPTPLNLSATVVDSTTIMLLWVAGNGVLDHYEVEQSIGNGSFSVIDSSVVTITFLDSGLSGGTLYHYRVRSVDLGGKKSPYSNVVNTTTGGVIDTAAPSVPQNFAYQLVSPTQVDLTWSPSTDLIGVTGYFVERCEGAVCANFTGIGATTSSTATTFSDSGVMANTTYRYRVRARDAAGNLSGFTPPLIVDPTPPMAPATLTVSIVTSTQITLTWTASNDNVGVTGYEIEQCQGASCSNFAQIATPLGTTMSDTDLLTNTSYSYRVRAIDAAGNFSSYSGTASATTTADTLPPLVSPVVGQSLTQSTATITWTTNEPADSQVEYGLTTAYGNVTPLDSTLETNHSVSLSGLTASTLYHVRVLSSDAAGNLATSVDATFTTAPDTTGPTVTIDQAGGQSDPTNGSSINFTVVFSESVADFATDDR